MYKNYHKVKPARKLKSCMSIYTKILFSIVYNIQFKNSRIDFEIKSYFKHYCENVKLFIYYFLYRCANIEYKLFSTMGLSQLLVSTSSHGNPRFRSH